MLLRSRLFRDYENVFTKATDLALTLRPLEFWQLAHHGKKNENPFCALLAENPATLAVCLQAHDEMIRHTRDIPHTVTCPFGLTETAVPVKLGRYAGILSFSRQASRGPQSRLNRMDTSCCAAARLCAESCFRALVNKRQEWPAVRRVAHKMDFLVSCRGGLAASSPEAGELKVDRLPS